MKFISDLSTGVYKRRLLGALVFCLAIAVFRFFPHYYDFSREDNIVWLTVFQVLSILVAFFLCLKASEFGDQSTKKAWQYLAIGNVIYFISNSYYVYLAQHDTVPDFPSAVEGMYFFMAIMFGCGLANYGDTQNRANKIAFYSFTLVYGAILIACLFLFKNSIENSVLSEFATMIAFAYPTLWLSVAAYGFMVLMIYPQGKRTFPYMLLVLFVAFEGAADALYAHSLLDGTYLRGGFTELSWIVSIGFCIWAALEHIAVEKESTTDNECFEHRKEKPFGLAFLPGVAILIIMVAGSFSHVFGHSIINLVFSLIVGVCFAAAVSLREFFIIGKLQSLSDDATAQQRRLSEVLESTSDSVIVVDNEWKLTYFNGSAQKIIGKDGKLKLDCMLWSDPQLDCCFPGREKLHEAFETQSVVEYEASCGKHGIWLGVHAFPNATGMSIFFRDISEHRQARIEIENLALRDTLTGLANRAAFHRELEKRVTDNTPVSILILDLDHFKEINDSQGHPIGDKVLQVISQRLQDCAENALVARLGGDEFIIILDHETDDERHNERQAALLADKIIQSVSQPVIIEDNMLRLGTSIGIALSRPKSDANSLLRNADIALYEVKNNGRGGYAFFQDAMKILLIERNDMKQALATALENNEFELHYQPLIDLKSGKVTSCEALLRWNHPEKGLMPPDTFIPLIEENGLIVPIGAWVMRTACQQALLWPDDVSVAVNISTRQFFDPSLLDTIKFALSDTGLPSHKLELEITESALLNDSGDNLITLSNIRKLGIKIALDDFGTGYSSLGYLQKFKFDKLKIDKSFIQGLNVKEESEAIVQSVIDLGKSLGMSIIAEGVETQKQYDWVHVSCDLGQGHFMSRALNEQDITKFFKQSHVFMPTCLRYG